MLLATFYTLYQVITVSRLFNFPSSLADGATARLLTDEGYIKQFVSSYQTRLAESYSRATQFFREHGIPYQDSNAALFLMVNLRAVVRDESLTDDDILALRRDKKVYVTSGSGYRTEQPGWFRVVIAHPNAVLDEGFKRITMALLP